MKSKKIDISLRARDIIASWRWRIVKANHTIKSFCALIDLNPSQMSEYLQGNVSPSVDTFDKIEGKLLELEAANVQG